MSRSGILAAGNWILDQVKLIDKFPAEQSLANIIEEYTSNGGSAYNILVALFKLHAPFPLEAAGLVGKDTNGRRIIRHCKDMGIDAGALQMTADRPTSYTIVTSVRDTGKRTFFHHRGANSLLDVDDFDFKRSKAKIFHLGYLLLLDRLDEVQPDGRTKASYLLADAKNHGFITSTDLVSENSNRFKAVVPCALPYVDYLFLNEFEASRLSGIDLLANSSLKEMDKKCKEVTEYIFGLGVNEWIIIHQPDGVWAAHRTGIHIYQPSLDLPAERIVGANGAGDALAAGMLFGIHEGWQMEACLKLGVCVAAASLSHITCSDGITSYADCLKLTDTYGFRG